MFYSRLNISLVGLHGDIAKLSPSSNSIPPSLVCVRVGLREKLTNFYTISTGWQERYSFDLTYHEHLFWNLQVDVYQSKTLRPQSHVGRYEARISQIAFNYDVPVEDLKPKLYDLRPKTCPTINFRLLGLKTAVEEESKNASFNSVFPITGGIWMVINYEHLATKLEVAKVVEEGDDRIYRDTLLFPANVEDDEDKESTLNLAENLYDSLESEHSLNIIAAEISSAGSYSQKPVSQHEIKNLVAPMDPIEFKEKVLSEQKSTWLETISAMVMKDRDHQAFRELKFIYSGFGQGLDLSAFSMGVALILLQRFYDLQPQIFTNNLQIHKEDLDIPRYLYRYTLASTGWLGLNFFGKRQGFLADAWRDQASYRALIDYLSIPESDLLVFNLDEDRVFRPGFFVCIDRPNSAVILSIRGSMSIRDGMTDLVCEYVPFKNGIAHSGFLKCSQWFFENIGRQLLMFAEEYGLENIYCVGHSLGGTTASLTAVHIYDHFMEREEGWPMCSLDPSKPINLHCYAYGPPPSISQQMVGEYDHLIDAFINGEDIVPCLSFGSVLDLHLMVSYAASISSASHLFRAIEATPTMARLQHCRNRIVASSNRINPKLFIMGRIHHIVALDAPNNERYRVIETVGPERFQEIKVTSKSISHHMPDRYEAALEEAYATFLKLEREKRVELADAEISRAAARTSTVDLSAPLSDDDNNQDGRSQ